MEPSPGSIRANKREAFDEDANLVGLSIVVI
jgi:hypothetical protein